MRPDRFQKDRKRPTRSTFEAKFLSESATLGVCDLKKVIRELNFLAKVNDTIKKYFSIAYVLVISEVFCTTVADRLINRETNNT